MLEEPKQKGKYSIITTPYKRLDFNNAHGFKNEMLDFIEQGHNQIILQMGNVGFMDSKGLSVFLFVYRCVRPDGVVVLVELSDQVRKIFALTKVDQVVPVYDRLQDALAALNE